MCSSLGSSPSVDLSVPYLEEDIMREIMIQTQTWGYHWNNTGPHGPEPYNEEYLAKFSKIFYHNEQSTLHSKYMRYLLSASNIKFALKN